MGISKQIVDFTKMAIEQINSLDKLIDNTLEPIKEYKDTIEDVVKPV